MELHGGLHVAGECRRVSMTGEERGGPLFHAGADLVRPTVPALDPGQLELPKGRVAPHPVHDVQGVFRFREGEHVVQVRPNRAGHDGQCRISVQHLISQGAA